jgi:UDP-N-acetyl-D-glucosamine dehydrogenase
MPEYVIDRIRRIMNERGKAIKGANMLVLGAAYKKDIKDLRESPALDVIRLLQEEGAKVQYNDPYAPVIKWDGTDLRSVKLTPALLKKAEMVVIVTDHTDYNYQWIVDNARLIFDTRNATKNVRTGRQKIHLL